MRSMICGVVVAGVTNLSIITLFGDVVGADAPLFARFASAKHFASSSGLNAFVTLQYRDSET